MITIGSSKIDLVVENGCLRSIGTVSVNGAALRNPQARFVPWFDSYEGEVFDRFEFLGVEQRAEETSVRLRAISNPTFPFRERRDSSGDLCFRNRSFDAPPVTSALSIVFKPAAAEVGGRTGADYYRLQHGSPCINSGTNLAWMTTAVDLEGNARILRGRVNMGAYEYVLPAGTVISIE